MSNNHRVDNDSWTILKTLSWTTDYFKRRTVENPRIDAEVLLAHTLGCDRIDLYVRHDQPLNSDELAEFKRLIKRRAGLEPVAYITGVKEFWSLPLQVTPAVLIPRPDTEILVEAAIDYLAALDDKQAARVLELGVGSGAITIAIAHEMGAGRYWATDLSWPAVCVARNNAIRNGVAEIIHFWLGDWFSPLSPVVGRFDLIVANPPYVPSADIERLTHDIKDFEPIAALDGGKDGMDHIRGILAQAHRHLRPGGAVMLEIGFDQRAAADQAARQCDGYSSIRFLKDYSGHDRVMIARKRSVQSTARQQD